MVLSIACDETGFTGSDLLASGQRYFVYASHRLDDSEAWEIVNKCRLLYPVQMPELKASKLLRTSRGRALMASIIAEAEGRFAITANNKPLALCGWLFEYIYEPVYRDFVSVLYDKDFHRFVANFCWLLLYQGNHEASNAINEFQKFMRSGDVIDAPLLFEKAQRNQEEQNASNPFECILKFSTTYRDVIIQDNLHRTRIMNRFNRWVLDLSAASLWCHLNHWGAHGQPLRVYCDVSKPLEAIVENFTGDQSDPAIVRVRELGKTEKFGWKLAGPIQFVDSRDHPSVQLADIIGGAAARICSSGVPEEFQEVAPILDAGMLPYSIFPDEEAVDISQRIPAVNYTILIESARRAGTGEHPYLGLSEFIAQAEVAWTRGELFAGG